MIFEMKVEIVKMRTDDARPLEREIIKLVTDEI
jgi:hypothetical protein